MTASHHHWRPAERLAQAVVTGAIGERRLVQRQPVRRLDGRRWRDLLSPRQRVEDHVGMRDASYERLGARRIDGGQPVSTAAKTLTIWRSPSLVPVSRRRTLSSARHGGAMLRMDATASP
jgi:hypothetical protein